MLFLDFDGVLHPHDAHFALADVKVPMEDWLAAGLFVHCDLLNDILEPHPEVRIAVHSTWRKTHDLRALRNLLGPLSHRVVGATAAILEREASVLDFMRRRGLRAEGILILDDEPASFAVLRSRVIACSRVLGLNDANVQGSLRAALNSLHS